MTVREIAVRTIVASSTAAQLVEPIDPPVGVLASEPGETSRGLDIGGDLDSRVGNAKHQGRRPRRIVSQSPLTGSLR